MPAERIQHAKITRALSGFSAIALIATLAFGVLNQGSYYPSTWLPLSCGVAIAAVSGLLTGRPPAGTLGWPPLVAVIALGAWALADGVLLGQGMSGFGTALLAAGMAAAMATVRTLKSADRAVLADGLPLLGGILAATTWAGVAAHQSRWAVPRQGLWRGAGAVTYPNVTAALLIALALWTLSRAGSARAAAPAIALTALMLAGAAATLSRGGALALVTGSIALLLVRRPTPRHVVAAGGGAALAVAGLLPSFPVGTPPHLLLACVTLAGGLLLAWVASLELPGRRGRVLAGGAVATSLVGFTVTALAVGPGTGALAGVVRTRLVLSTSHRLDAAAAALRQILRHPVLGVGPGNGQVSWVDASGAELTTRLLHDEYLQVLLELGAVGGLLLLVFAGACIHAARTARPAAADPRADPDRSTWAAAVAATTALAVSGLVDFVWHLPAVALAGAVVLAFTGIAPGRGRSASPAPPREVTSNEGVDPTCGSPVPEPQPRR